MNPSLESRIKSQLTCLVTEKPSRNKHNEKKYSYKRSNSLASLLEGNHSNQKSHSTISNQNNYLNPLQNNSLVESTTSDSDGAIRSNCNKKLAFERLSDSANSFSSNEDTSSKSNRRLLSEEDYSSSSHTSLQFGEGKSVHKNTQLLIEGSQNEGANHHKPLGCRRHNEIGQMETNQNFLDHGYEIIKSTGKDSRQTLCIENEVRKETFSPASNKGNRVADQSIMKLQIRFRSILAILLVIVNMCSISVSGQVMPCPFNSMCKCRYEAPDEETPRSRIPVPIEVICINVPFAKFPKLPPGVMDQVDVVNAGLELLSLDDFDLTRVKNLRLMSNNIRKIGSKTLSEMGQTLFTLDISYNKLVDIPRDALRHLGALEWLNLQGNQIAEVRRDDWNGLRDTLTSLLLGENTIDYIAPHVMTDFRRLLWVNLDDNNINRIERDSLARTINTLSLNHNLLTSFPVDTINEFKDLAWLYLRGNLIDKLQERGFIFQKNLDILDLGENFISFIPKGWLNNTLSVRDLHLDFNILTEIHEYSFRGLNPSRLYLSANKIFNVSNKAFLGGPEESLVMLDLEKNALDAIPKAISTLKNLRYLYLPGNEIIKIQRNAFRGSCSKLEALSLSGNYLTAIPREGLENCSMINHLNLGHNRIDEISADDFETWGDSLETLVLRNNKLYTIPANTFKYTPKLRELSLSFNRIVEVNQDSFIDILGTLEIIEISFGFYRDDFPEEVFKPLTSLQWIALDNNNFRTISETALYSFGELSYFNMDSNRLTRIPKTLFHQNVHKKLVDIRMANNFLEAINTHTFHNLINLRTLVLTGNKITKVYFEAFKALPNLNTISLSNNKIIEIKNQAFSGTHSLNELELQVNNLTTFSLNVFANISMNQAPLSLNLSHNQLNDLLPGSVGQYPMKNLDLDTNALRKVPVNFIQVFALTLETLFLGNNQLTKLDTSAFGPLEKLQRLVLKHNKIEQIRPGAFKSLREVQLLDLSHNHLTSLPHMCFGDMASLRKLDFSFNDLGGLPPSVFTGTRIETLNFNHNEFVSMPTAALSIVEQTLHYLDFSYNQLGHLDSTMFNSFSNLIELNLARNKLMILPDNVFMSLRNLVSLDISENTVRANFKELFHYTQNVQKLNLAKIGFTSSPSIPLPNLVSLNLSSNGIPDIEEHTVVSLRQLRSLDLSHNKIMHVHPRIWPYVPYLQTLDLSYNPIQSFTKDSFMGASRIETLILKSLDEIKRFDYDTLSHMGYLKELYMNTFPHIEKYRFRVGQLLATVHTLRTFHLEVREESLDDQLSGAFGPKLKELHITGKKLKHVEDKTFRGFQNKHELLLAITDTSIESLPHNLLLHLSDVAYLSLDLRRNKLKYLSSHVLYGNTTDWESNGTTFVAGGIALQGNEWTCDCSLVWLGRWLRRWLRETLQIHTAVIKKAQQVDQLAREATCYEPSTGNMVPLLELRSEYLSCHASALSDTAHTSKAATLSPLFPSVLMLMIVQTFFTTILPLNLTENFCSSVLYCCVLGLEAKKKLVRVLQMAIGSQFYGMITYLLQLKHFLGQRLERRLHLSAPNIDSFYWQCMVHLKQQKCLHLKRNCIFIFILSLILYTYYITNR